MNEAYGFPTTLQRYLDTAIFAVLVMLVAAVAPEAQSDVRLKDLAKVQMGKEELLYGIGLVIGLEGTGDGRRAEFTFQMMSNMIVRQGISVTPAQVRVRNVAGAAVTATLSPFDRSGGRLDVHVASLGDASSLQGGTLLLTNLVGSDGRTYATASGPLSIGGFNLGGGGGGSVSKNHAVAGYIPNGGLVIDELEKLEEIERKITLMLYDKDWTTATRAAFGIDSYFGEPMLAQALDAGTVEVQVGPHRGSAQALSEFIAEIEKIRIVPDLPARVVVNEKTGTVVIGDNVSVSAVALSHGSLKLKIPGEAQGDMLGGGGAEVEEEPDHLHPIINSFNVGAMPTVRELVRSLNALGVTPRDLISILQGLKTAGALRADLIIQ